MITCDDTEGEPIARPARRLGCCVPHCKGTRGDRKGDPLPADLDGFTWICSRHWSRVSRRVKAYNALCKRRERLIRKAWWRVAYKRGYTPQEHERWQRAHQRAIRRWDHAWDQCMASAIEAAAGI